MRQEFPEADGLEIAIQARERAREQVITRVLLSQAARLNSARLDPVSLADDATADLAIERLLADITAVVARPGKSETEAFYRRNRESFFRPEGVHAFHIVKNVDETSGEDEALAAINDVDRLLRAGGSFEELADQYSDCPGRGGDLGFFHRGEMVEEFEAIVFGLRVGEISGVFRTCFGYHIARLHARKPAGIRPFSEVRPQLEAELWQRRRDEAVRIYVRGLREKAEISRA